jgi:hypothetical protein
VIVAAILIGMIGSPDLASAQPFEAHSGKFPDVDRMEQSLMRGESTKSDVIALLGKPAGRGGALSGLQPDRPREIWLYEELDASMIDTKGGVLRLHIAQQFLMVYFVDGKFDGFWWHDTSAPVKGALLLGESPRAQTGPTSANTAISTPEEFHALVAGRRMTNDREWVEFVLEPNGTMSGKRADGTKLSGPWYFKDGLFCRESTVGKRSQGWDCQIVTVNGDEVTFHRKRGTGKRAVYRFL